MLESCLSFHVYLFSSFEYGHCAFVFMCGSYYLVWIHRISICELLRVFKSK